MTLFVIQTGTWIIEAAKQWPACEFVSDNYHLVDPQTN